MSEPTEEDLRFGILSLPRGISDRIEPEPISGCWLWSAGLGSGGYGSLYVDRRNVRAHRYVYEFFRGAIPPGLVIDHLCRVRSCVNPAHLEVVTDRENILRGEGLSAQWFRSEVCRFGHRDWKTSEGKRKCRTCANQRNAEYRRRQPPEFHAQRVEECRAWRRRKALEARG